MSKPIPLKSLSDLAQCKPVMELSSLLDSKHKQSFDVLEAAKDDWLLYLSVIICSVIGGLVGSKMFEYVKDSKDTIRGILAVFLVLCGVSLLFSAFRK